MKNSKKKADPKKNNNNGSKKTKKGNSIIKKFLKVGLLLVIFLFLIGIGTTIAVSVSYIQEAPEFDPENLKLQETSYVYDNEGNKVTQLHGEQNRIVVPIEEIPEHVQQAFIAIEDERFYDHIGVDLVGIARASWINLRSGGIVQGASTITQQLARNAFLTSEQTLKRKIQEAWMAINLEREYSKEEILEKYLNHIYFGNGAYGVEAASQTYFGKSVDELDTAEAAELAGIPSAPQVNNPWHSEERSQRNRNYVLSRMKNMNFISSEEANKSGEKELEYAVPDREDYPHPYFIDYVLHRELIDILTSMPTFDSRGDAYNAIYTQGLRVYTTMDTSMQSTVEDTLNNDEFYPETLYIDIDKLKEAFRENNNRLPHDYPGAYIDEERGVPQPQGAMMLANPGSGEIKALGGGRHYHRQINEVLRYASRRQPGSAIKPITVYAPAFEEGLITPGTVLDDAPKVYDDIPAFTPSNWDGAFWGLATVRDVLVHSRNIPAVTTFEELTPQKGAEYAEQMGIRTILEEERNNLSLALGGFQAGATVIDMGQAYSVLANEGIKSDLHTVTRIEDREGNLIWEREVEPRQVLSRQTAYQVNDILKGVPGDFVGSWLHIDRPLAAKTGTTDGQADRYLASYTPNLTSIVWMGYDIRDMGGIASPRHTAKITNKVLNEVLNDIPEEDFYRPSGFEETQICTKSGQKPTELCKEAGTVTTELFPREQLPEDTCERHVEKTVCTGAEDNGNYYLPSNYCPSESLVERVFLDRPDFILTDGRWRLAPSGVGPADATEMPPNTECELHGEGKVEERAINLRAFWQVGDENVRLSWEVEDEDLDINNYTLSRKKEGEGFRMITDDISGHMESYTDNYVYETGVTYIYRLEAFKDTGGTIVSVTEIEVPAENNEENESASENGSSNDEENNNGEDHNNENNDSEENLTENENSRSSSSGPPGPPSHSEGRGPRQNR